MKKRILALVLCLALLGAAPAHAADGEAAAETLYSLGLFQGAAENPDGSPDFALGRAATRTEALVMLIRLLGREAEAKSYAGAQPFTDVPGWARGYVAYAYASGLTDGVSETLFGAQQTATANMYLTFVLRALGYDDKAASPDFRYAEAAAFAGALGLTEGVDTQGFLRGDVAAVSLAALSQPLKGAETSLVQSLVDAFAVDPAAARAAGFDVREAEAIRLPARKTETGLVVDNADVRAALPAAASCCLSPVGITEETRRTAELLDCGVEEVILHKLLQATQATGLPAESLAAGTSFLSHSEVEGDGICFFLDGEARVLAVFRADRSLNADGTVTLFPARYDLAAMLRALQARIEKAMEGRDAHRLSLDMAVAYSADGWEGWTFREVLLDGESLPAGYTVDIVEAPEPQGTRELDDWAYPWLAQNQYRLLYEPLGHVSVSEELREELRVVIRDAAGNAMDTESRLWLYEEAVPRLVAAYDAGGDLVAYAIL